MKKLSLLLISIALLLLCAVSLTSCDSRLNTPSGLNIEIETQTLKWNRVKGARSYTIQISGQDKQIITAVPHVSLEHLDPGIYTIKVRANGDGKAVDNSKWKETQFERFAESGLKYQLINNGSEYQLIGAGSASGDVVMESMFRNKPVTSIAEKALHSNTKITSIKIGANVKTIGEKAFTKCSRLTSVIIEGNVESIGAYAFQSCKELTSVTLPDSITSIAPHTFAWCSKLTEVKVGKNLASIGEYAFSNCDELKKITYEGIDEDFADVILPDSMEYIGQYAFSECKALKAINLGATKQVDVCAFADCQSLASIGFGTRLTDIGDTAFRNCTSLTEVSIPDSARTLGNGCFYGCTNLNKLSLGSGLVKVGHSLLADTAIMNSATDILIIDGWLLQVIDLTIKELHLTEDVYGIGAYAVVGCTELGQVTLPNVKYICEAAFSESAAITTVTLGDSILEIADYAFYGCPYLDKINFGENLVSIGSYAFCGCERLKSATLPNTVTSIGTRAFRDSGAYDAVVKSKEKSGAVYIGNWLVDYVAPTRLQSLPTLIINDGTRGIANYAVSSQMFNNVVMPDSVEYIGRGAFYGVATYVIEISRNAKIIDDYAFYGCSYTRSFGGDENFTLTIPDGVEYIGRSAFYGCECIISVTVPGSVKTIGPYAFFSCWRLGSTVKVEVQTGEKDEDGNPIVNTEILTGKLVLSDGIEYIGDKAFQQCQGLVSVTIPNSVTAIGEKVFYKIPGLKSVTIGTGLKEIPDYTFYKCEALESVVILGSPEKIGNYAFRGCAALKSVDLGGTKNIGRYAFYACSALTDIIITDSVSSIGDYAFRGCNALTAIMLPDSVTTIGKHTFYNLNETTIYCESTSALPGWDEKSNSSFRPMIFGCKFSDDGSYVVSFTVSENSISNHEAKNGISNPTRKGYVFNGWATEEGSTNAVYTSETISDATVGLVLYAIWTEQPNDNTQEG